MLPPSPIQGRPEADPPPLPSETLRYGPIARIPLPPPRPKRRWLIWLPIILSVLWPLSYIQLAPIPTIPVILAFLLLTALNAVEHFPFHDGEAKRRLRFIPVLLLPPLAAWLLSPLGFLPPGRFALTAEQLLHMQDSCLAAAVLLPLGLSIAMRGGRRFTLVIGVIGVVLTFLIVAVHSVILVPGS